MWSGTIWRDVVEHPAKTKTRMLTRNMVEDHQQYAEIHYVD